MNDAQSGNAGQSVDGGPDDQSDTGPDKGPNGTATEPAESASAEASVPREPARELGGREGPDPTRFGDWEKAGRCIDF